MCKNDFDISSMGESAVQSHVKGDGHFKIGQLFLEIVLTGS